MSSCPCATFQSLGQRVRQRSPSSAEAFLCVTKVTLGTGFHQFFALIYGTWWWAKLLGLTKDFWFKIKSSERDSCLLAIAGGDRGCQLLKRQVLMFCFWKERKIWEVEPVIVCLHSFWVVKQVAFDFLFLHCEGGVSSSFKEWCSLCTCIWVRLLEAWCVGMLYRPGD